VICGGWQGEVLCLQSRFPENDWVKTYPLFMMPKFWHAAFGNVFAQHKPPRRCQDSTRSRSSACFVVKTFEMLLQILKDLTHAFLARCESQVNLHLKSLQIETGFLNSINFLQLG
jgi:hypothetical protein